MRPATCPQRELAVGWALHSLEPEEEASFSLHLPHCAACQTQVAATEDTAALLGSSVPQIDPPARLRASILDAARATAHTPRHAAVDLTAPDLTAVVPAPSHGEFRPADAPLGVVDPPRSGSARATRTVRARGVLVAAAAVLVLGIGAVAGWAGTTISGDSGSTTQADAAASQAVVRDLADSGVRQVVLTQPGRTEPVALLLQAQDHDMVLPVDLPAVDASQQVWVWGVDGTGPPVPLGGVVKSTADTTALGASPVDTSANAAASRSYPGYALSVEPAGTTPVTPTTVIASGLVRA